MQLTGTHIVDAGSSRIWNMLMDTGTLAKLIPGISSLEKTGDNAFKSILNMRIGPVSGSFSGNLNMDDIIVEKGFSLKLQQNSKIGNASAIIKIDLLPVNEDQTKVSFNGEVKLSGLLATMGQRVIGSVADTVSKQFFTNLEKELGKTKVL
jgi:carbon monoxide dehydrogenase subunit G